MGDAIRKGVARKITGGTRSTALDQDGAVLPTFKLQPVQEQRFLCRRSVSAA